MPLPDPKLDDRQFQDIVNEAKMMIPRYCPEWTDHNVSDPGVTLIELFAWMTDLILYRVNRVPEKNYLRFMDLLGIRLKDAVPARTPLSFWLTAPQPGPLGIPRGTEVSTVRTGDRDAISFTTDDDLVIVPPTLRQFFFSSDDTNYTDYMPRLELDGELFDAFQRVPLPGDALHFGFAEDLSRHILAFTVDCVVEGIGVDPRDPPLSWEAWCGETRGWVRCIVEADTTGGLNQFGVITLHLPAGMELRTLVRQAARWLRVRVLQPRPRQPVYSASPKINTVKVASVGGTSQATHARVVSGEILPRASGVPGETIASRINQCCRASRMNTWKSRRNSAHGSPGTKSNRSAIRSSETATTFSMAFPARWNSAPPFASRMAWNGSSAPPRRVTQPCA